MSKGWRRAIRSSASGRPPRCSRTSSATVGSSSGSGTIRAGGSWCSNPASSGRWKDAVRLKIVRPCCTAVTRRVVKDRPSRPRPTSYTIGTPGRPGRRKYACRECTGRSPSVVRPAATSACPATCPPKTRCRDSSGLRPRKMLTSIRSRSSRSTRLSAGFVMRFFSTLLAGAPSQLAHGRDPDDRPALLVGGREIDLRTDSPVVVPGRVGERLPHPPQTVPGVLVDLQQLRAARVRARAQLLVRVPVRVHRLAPGVLVPARVGVQLTQVADLVQSGQLHPAEHRVAHEDPEGAGVGGHRLDIVGPLLRLLGGLHL